MCAAGAAHAGDLTIAPYSIADPQGCIEASDRLRKVADMLFTVTADLYYHGSEGELGKRLLSRSQRLQKLGLLRRTEVMEACQ